MSRTQKSLETYVVRNGGEGVSSSAKWHHKVLVGDHHAHTDCSPTVCMTRAGPVASRPTRDFHNRPINTQSTTAARRQQCVRRRQRQCPSTIMMTTRRFFCSLFPRCRRHHSIIIVVRGTTGSEQYTHACVPQVNRIGQRVINRTLAKYRPRARIIPFILYKRV